MQPGTKKTNFLSNTTYNTFEKAMKLAIVGASGAVGQEFMNILEAVSYTHMTLPTIA